MSYNRSFKLLLSVSTKIKELNQKEKMLHNHGSLDNPILFKSWEKAGEGWGGGGVERERMLLPRPLAVTDFKKLSKKLCP